MYQTWVILTKIFRSYSNNVFNVFQFMLSESSFTEHHALFIYLITKKKQNKNAACVEIHFVLQISNYDREIEIGRKYFFSCHCIYPIVGVSKRIKEISKPLPQLRMILSYSMLYYCYYCYHHLPKPDNLNVNCLMNKWVPLMHNFFNVPMKGNHMTMSKIF